jgi:hypothetical protein
MQVRPSGAGLMVPDQVRQPLQTVILVAVRHAFSIPLTLKIAKFLPFTHNRQTAVPHPISLRRMIAICNAEWWYLQSSSASLSLNAKSNSVQPGSLVYFSRVKPPWPSFRHLLAFNNSHSHSEGSDLRRQKSICRTVALLQLREPYYCQSYITVCGL